MAENKDSGKMGTRDYDLQESRDARDERASMLASFAAEKEALLGAAAVAQSGKNYIIYMLIAANLFQAALILGRSLTVTATPEGVEASTSPVEAEAVHGAP